MSVPSVALSVVIGLWVCLFAWATLVMFFSSVRRGGNCPCVFVLVSGFWCCGQGLYVFFLNISFFYVFNNRILSFLQLR